MAKKIMPEMLPAEWAKIIQEYSTDLVFASGEAVIAAGKKAATAARNASAAIIKPGGYAKGWTSQNEGTRLIPKAVVWNATVPGLPHLLEHGHATRNGGRVAGREHIGPVERQAEVDFVLLMEGRLNKI